MDRYISLTITIYLEAAFSATEAAELNGTIPSMRRSEIRIGRLKHRIKHGTGDLMLRNMFGLMVIVVALSAPARADTLKVMAAGSLRVASARRPS